MCNFYSIKTHRADLAHKFRLSASIALTFASFAMAT